MSFFAELKRRNVLRVAAAYVVTAWLAIQVVETIFPLYGLSDASIRLIITVLAIGLLPVIVVAWAFEITPEGVKLERHVDRSGSITSRTGKRLDRLILVVLALAVSYFAIDKFVLSESREASIAETARQEGRTSALVESYGDKSIAVLPFIDMSPEHDQEYMSDGIAEELLNLLAKVPELRVISRSSAFSFKGRNLEITEIAERLDVGHILEGSVRKAGDRIRITAQLIDARSDTHLWSEAFDRDLADVFAIQDEIALTVVEQLKAELLGAAPAQRETDPEAYALYLRGRHLDRRGGVADRKLAIQYYKDALAIDPGLIDAWNGLSTAYWNLSGRGMPADEAIAKSKDATQHALATDPDDAGARAGMGDFARLDGDFQLAVEHYNQALAVEPGSHGVLISSAIFLATLGRYEEAIPVYEWLARRDPVSPAVIGNLGDALIETGRFEEAIDAIDKAIVLSPENVAFRWNRIRLLYFHARDYETALELCESLDDAPELVTRRLLCRAFVYPRLGREEEGEAALTELEAMIAEDSAVPIAAYYAWHEQPDDAVEWLEKAYQIDGKAAISSVWRDVIWDPIRDDPSLEALLKRAGVSREQIAAIEFEVPLPD